MDFAPDLDDFGICPFANITNKPCVLCGGTRAIVSMAQFDFAEAIRMNFFVVVGFFIVLSYFLFGLVKKDFKLSSLKNINQTFDFFFMDNLYFFFTFLALGWFWNIFRW